jgi:hypothetical protein
MFCNVFHVRNANFCFLKEFFNFLYFFTAVCESGPFGFLVL